MTNRRHHAHLDPDKQEVVVEKRGGGGGTTKRLDLKPTISRRQFLEAGLVTGAALLAESCSSPTVSRSSCPPNASINQIEHVIILMIENRSFDHFYGTYPGVRGFSDHPSGELGAFAQPWSENTFNPPKGTLLPYHLNTAVGNASVIGNVNVPTHNWAPQHMSWANGKMDAFVTTHALQHYDTPAYAPLVMGYYERSDLPFWYALADHFTLADNYYCSVLGPTMPNRLYAMSASIDPAGLQGGPILTTPNISGPGSSAQFIFSCSWTTMFERLESQGVSWKVYQQPGSSVGALQSLNLAIAFNALLYFKQYQDPSSSLYKKAFLPSWPDEFEADIAKGELPAVSWLIPPIIASAHPPAPAQLAAWMISRVINALTSNQKIWEKSVLFITFDENGGFFDHVVPPTPERGTPGEWLTTDPLPEAARGIDGPIGLGFRVPLLVVSPFSRGGFINSDPFDHTSLLRFLETRFGVEVPNLSSWRREMVGDLTSTLGLPDNSLPKLPPAPLDNPDLLRQYPAGKPLLSKASPAEPVTVSALEAIMPLAFQTPVVPPPPTPQVMPGQEGGTPKRLTHALCKPSKDRG